MARKYDYLVIGSGPAGHVSAIRAAQLGLKVGVVEKDENMFGGVCLNEGCIPAKSLYHCAEMFDIVKKNHDMCGLDVHLLHLNMTKLVQRSREATEQLCKGLLFLFKKNEIDLIRGKAVFVDKGTVMVSEKDDTEAIILKADKFLIATGSSPRALSIMPFDRKRVISSSEAIRLQKTPGKILIIGGGAIGVEFASFFNFLGTDVTLVEMEDSLLPMEDREISRRFRSIFERRGIKVRTSSRVKMATIEEKKVAVVIQEPAGEVEDEYEIVLVSIGRVPVTGDLDIYKASVEVDDTGFIKVDGKMRTSTENIYAAGDVVRTPMLAHAANAEGEVAAEAAAGHDPEPVDYGCVPNAVYTAVQAASVGMTEEKAKEGNLDFSVGKQFYKSNGRGVVNSQTEGFIKIIADNNTHKLLGVHILGHDASEYISEFVLAKKAGLRVEDIEKTIHAHPTFSETAVDACRAVFGKPIHG